MHENISSWRNLFHINYALPNIHNFMKIFDATLSHLHADIDAKKCCKIAMDQKLDMNIFKKGHKAFKNSTKFGKIFSNVNGYTKKKLAHVYRVVNPFKDESDMSNESQKKEMYHIPSIRDFENQVADGLPRYIHQSLWKNGEENVESLIDEAVHKLSKSHIWEKIEFIEMLYSDSKYCIAVQEVYNEMNKDQFFTEFVEKYYKLQMEIWKIKQEDKTILDTTTKIFFVLQNVKFTDLDKAGNGVVDKDNFKQYFEANGMKISASPLIFIFSKYGKSVNGKLDKDWFEKFKNDQNNVDHLQKIKTENSLHFGWNQYSNCYDFREHNGTPIASIHDESFDWAYFETDLNTLDESMQPHPFLSQTQTINGYWKLLKEDEKLKDHLTVEHLDNIFALLNHYYRMTIDKQVFEKDKSVLGQYIINETVSENPVLFSIENRYKYELIYWNQQGKFETNTISLKLIQDKDEKEQKDNEIQHYMRFNSKKDGLEWEWYDNDDAKYKPFGLYDNDGVSTLHKPLIVQLEASYLANIQQNFDLIHFTKIKDEKQDEKNDNEDDEEVQCHWKLCKQKHYKSHLSKAVNKEPFNNCLLPELYRYVHEKIKLPLRGKRDYLLSFSFFNDQTGKISNIEQISYTNGGDPRLNGTSFPRNVVRNIYGKNSLYTSAKLANGFAGIWKQSYKLFSTQQQLYFWCHILSIVTMMKYIDIEFSNQAVLQPLEATKRDYASFHAVEGIDSAQIKQDQLNAIYFDGYAVPPSNILRLVQNNDNTEIALKIVSKSVILREAQDTLYDSKSNVFTFDKDAATLLRLTECIRKFVLQYEVTDTLSKIWPWYRNSFHMNDIQLYNDEMMRYNLFQEYNIKTILDCLKDVDIRITDIKRNVIVNDNVESIRHKRKFAAQSLLQPDDIMRNLNVIRNQLSLLLSDLMDEKEIKEDEEKEEKIKAFVHKHLEDIEDWYQIIKKTNTKRCSDAKHLGKLKTLNMDKCFFPVLESFVSNFFY
eukprot:468608_1